MTLPRSGRRIRTYDFRLFTMANRLFAEFDDLPVGVVLHAIAQARSLLRDIGHVLPPPETVERSTRELLLQLQG